MNRVAAALALVFAASAALPAQAKDCPGWHDILGSLDRHFEHEDKNAVQKFFTGHPGHKWEGFEKWAKANYMEETIAFIYAAKGYEHSYDSLPDDAARHAAATSIKNEMTHKLNVGHYEGQSFETLFGTWAQLTSDQKKQVFKKLIQDVISFIGSDALTRFQKSVQTHGLPEAGTHLFTGKPKYDETYKNCTIK
jgi:hypothetical protein